MSAVSGPPRSSSRHVTTLVNTISCSSIPHTKPPSDLGRALSAALPPVLAPGARVVTESDRRAALQLELRLLDERRYGDTLIRIHDSR